MEVNPRKKPNVMEMGKLPRWLKRMGVREQIMAEWGPPSSIAKIQRDGSILATFRTSTGWKIDEKALNRLAPEEAMSEEGSQNDLEDMG